LQDNAEVFLEPFWVIAMDEIIPAGPQRHDIRLVPRLDRKTNLFLDEIDARPRNAEVEKKDTGHPAIQFGLTK
jgi:hypothetical protein